MAMFEPGDKPRVFALPPGVDFPRAVIAGLRSRLEGQPPEALAGVTLFVNTRRMARRFAELFDQDGATLLPRIRLITDLGQDAAFADLPPAVSPLRRRLELAGLVSRLLDVQPDLAPRSAIFDLADSLAALMDEMQGEGVDPAALRDLEVSEMSGHWARSLAFLDLVEGFFGAESGEMPDPEARQRRVIERLVAEWEADPPPGPMIVAGSTGSRGATQLFMRALARLPQGALILPGFDFDMPDEVWSGLDNALDAEGHPQFRFARILAALDLTQRDVRPWPAPPPPDPRRNAFVSLALRPAPVTDQWRVEGPKFGEIDSVSAPLTLIEAPNPRSEALAIALVLRHAVEAGRTAALVTPDRELTRQVTAALDRWRIEPDDSAGHPLGLTAPGRLLRHVADMAGETMTGPHLLTLLKHPLANTGSGARGDHLRHLRDLELEALRGSMPFPDAASLADWAQGHDDRVDWADWVGALVSDLAQGGTRPLADHLAQVLDIATRLATGPGGEGAGALWDKPAGRETQRIVGELEREADAGPEMSAADFRSLFAAILGRGEVRDPVAPHPQVKIWGTLEARAMGVDLAVLAGLNEGTWPEAPAPDPWLNRRMRHDAGLLLPERRIGLSAHDFQQAIAAPEVVLSRAIRSAESQTVPSRWLNRITNLMHGMSDEGAAALKAMRLRGDGWLDRVRALEEVRPVARAPRPAPRPPVEARPKRLSVTRISKLVRDPYSIYAEYVLRLRALDPLHQAPDAALRGTILHRVMERFVTETPVGETRTEGRARLMDVAAEVLDAEAPWPAARLLWLARLSRIADDFFTGEEQRRELGDLAATEVRGRLEFPEIDFRLTGTADRIDRGADGQLYIYDYKSGRVPTEKEREYFDKQLALEAVMAKAGAFDGLAAAPVAEVAYIGLGASPKFDPIPVTDESIAVTRAEFVTLMSRYRVRSLGYMARRGMQKQTDPGDYDHLSRFGEWDHSAPFEPEDVG